MDKIINTNHEVLYEDVKMLNNQRHIYNAHIGVRDMKMVVDFSQCLKSEIQY